MATTNTITIADPVLDPSKPSTDGAKPQEVDALDAAPVKFFAFQFPPFPPVPEGKTIIPFKDFKAKGVIPADSDEDEFDAEGVRTVRLPVKHIPDPEERAAHERAKRARKRRRGNQGAGLGPVTKAKGDGPIKAWLDEWEDDRYRERITPMDPNSSREDRFTSIMTDFQTDRTFPRGVQSVYDNLRIFCGLLENVQNPPGSKRAKRRKKSHSDDGMDAADDADEPMEEDMGGAGGDFSDDDEEIPETEEAPAPKIEEVPVEEEKPSKRNGFGGRPNKAVPWSNTEKMDRFLDDPEMMLKLFFSHFSYERGMIWDIEKRRSGPALIKFILEYIIRHGTLKELKPDFERAVKLAERAQIEQPAVGELADVLPDAFHVACREHFGRWDIGMWGTAENNEEWAAAAKEEDTHITADGWAAEGNDWGAAAGGSGKFGLVTDEDLQKEGMTIDPAASDGWSLPAEVTADPLTEDSDDKAAASTQPQAGASAWDVGPSWEAIQLPSIKDFLPNPPLDMKIIRVEHSVRQILSVEPPNPNSASEWRKTTGVIVFAPWSRHRDDAMSYTPFPTMNKEDLTDVAVVPPHDPIKDAIRVLAGPETIEKLSERLGMGVNGYWVQVAKKGATDAAEQPAKKKKKGKSADPDSSQHFWYLETSTQILQTYWIEPEDLQ